MALPTYDKNQRRKSFEQLPKGAYVIKIIGVREEENSNRSGSHLKIAFDIAEGEHKNFYQDMYDHSTSEDRKWPNDAVFYLSVPDKNSQPYVFSNWNTFFADLEDSNNGFVFAGDVKSLTGKLIGGKFRLEQSEYNGKVYDHTRMTWTCVADDVRKGKAGRMPADKLHSGSTSSGSASASANTASESPDWMKIPEGSDDTIPF